MPQRVLNVVRRLIIAIFIAVLTCELGLRIVIADVGGPPHVLASDDQATISHLLLPNLDDQTVLPDMSLDGFTVRDNMRRTTDQPPTWTRTLWLFGNSTAWGLYVNDSGTIASALQRDLLHAGLDWRVQNASIIAGNASVALYWLQRRAVRPGDVVLYFDGNLDERNMVDSARRAWQKSLPPCVAASAVPLITLRLWCETLTTGLLPAPFLEAQADQMVQYWSAVDRSAVWTHAHGATFVHVLAPPIYGEVTLYAKFARGEAVTTIDAADNLDGLHYTAHGSEVIAAQLLDLITPRPF